jgi:hypothetical protein
MRKTLITLLSLGGAALWIVPAGALMPPRVERISVEDQGKLPAGDPIVIRGHSLGYADPSRSLEIVDVESGKTVPWRHENVCMPEGDCGEGSPPGACQQACRLTVHLEEPKVGQTLKLTYLGSSVTFTIVAAKGKND